MIAPDCAAPDFPIPTAGNQQEFLLVCYFGIGTDHLSSCVQRAYRDFNRTLHGFSKLQNKTEVHHQAAEYLREALASLSRTDNVLNQASFDTWHQSICVGLCKLYSENGFGNFFIGHAQKWINMAFKYTHIFGGERLPGFARLYHLGHVPLDNVILSAFIGYGARRLECAWSRIQNYEYYLDYQRWIRQRFPHSAPLSAEFFLWTDEARRVIRSPLEG